jgi:hypothetical protein
MTSLTDQAERALLGAMLADQPTPAELSYLRADDFADRIHAGVFQVITDVRRHYPELTGQPLLAAIALRAEPRTVDVDWLAETRDACPQPEHVAAYARMVQAAGFRRDVAGHADRIATAAAHTIDVDGHAHLTKLADALARQSEIYAAFHTLETDATPPWIPDVDAWRITAEEELLADLLHHPEQAADIAAFVHSDTFTSPQRQFLFETVTRMGIDGDDIDPVVILWEMASIRAITPHYDRDATDPVEPDAVLLDRLAHTRPARSAIETGRNLIADDMRVALADRLHTLDPTIADTRPARTPGVNGDLRPPTPPATNGHPAPRVDR